MKISLNALTCPSRSTHPKTAPNYHKFVKRFGNAPQTELDALHPRDLTELIQQSLKSVLDMSDIEDQKAIEVKERQQLKRAKHDFELFGRDHYPMLFS